MIEGIAQRYTAVCQRIEAAAERANRHPDEVTLIAVTKTWPATICQAAYTVGMRHFGENRAEALAEKRQWFETAVAPAGSVTWHAIGTLQSRKTAVAAAYADQFHACDRRKIIEKLSQQVDANGRQLSLFLEVNISGETSKAGFACDRWETDTTQQDGLRIAAEQLLQAPSLTLAGLMTMAPWEADTAVVRHIFRRTRALADWLQNKLALPAPLHLSMGMTDDFELAIEEGATHIRVGRALFGERS